MTIPPKEIIRDFSFDHAPRDTDAFRAAPKSAKALRRVPAVMNYYVPDIGTSTSTPVYETTLDMRVLDIMTSHDSNDKA